MTVWPTVERASLLLPTLPGHDDALWDTLIELTELRPGERTLIGGQMVYLHAIEHAAPAPRVSTDLDVRYPGSSEYAEQLPPIGSSGPEQGRWSRVRLQVRRAW